MLIGLSLKMYFGWVCMVEWIWVVVDICVVYLVVCEGLVELFVILSFVFIVEVMFIVCVVGMFVGV